MWPACVPPLSSPSLHLSPVDVHHSLHINHQSVAPFSPPPGLNLFTFLSFPFLYRESRLIRRSLDLIFIKGWGGGGGRRGRFGYDNYFSQSCTEQGQRINGYQYSAPKRRPSKRFCFDSETTKRCCSFLLYFLFVYLFFARRRRATAATATLLQRRQLGNQNVGCDEKNKNA